MTSQPLDISRLSLNQMTVRNLDVPAAVDLCARNDIHYIGLWREPVARSGLRESARAVRDAGLRVSGLCRGGFFAAATEAQRQARLDDNRRAVEEAATLGADLLVLVCGGTPDQDLGGARQMVAQGISELLPFAREHGVRLGVEPLHPMYAATRSVIVTLKQALDMIQGLPPESVGVVIDIYHVWWDPDLYTQIQRAQGRIFGFHLCDWLDPMPDFVNGRGLMGDGWAAIRNIREAVDAASYSGPVEVEIFNQDLWNLPSDEVIARIKERWQTV